LRYLAEGDRAELATEMAQAGIAANHLTTADFRWSKDARSGPARVTIFTNDADTAILTMRIRYADGAVEHTGIMNEQAQMGQDVWKIEVGADFDSQ
jgi:hypothetical protein